MGLAKSTATGPEQCQQRNVANGSNPAVPGSRRGRPLRAQIADILELSGRLWVGGSRNNRSRFARPGQAPMRTASRHGTLETTRGTDIQRARRTQQRGAKGGTPVFANRRIQDVLEGGPERAKIANSSDFASTMFSRCSGVPKSLSEGVVSGPDKLQKTVAPPGGTERRAIQYTGVVRLSSPGHNLNCRN